MQQLLDQLAVIRWQHAQLCARLRKLRRKLERTETTAEVRIRVAQQSAQALQMAARYMLQTP